MIEFITLLISIIIILTIIYYIKLPKRLEGFQSAHTSDSEYHLESCPSGYKSFYNLNGDIVCCGGEILANKCISDRRCGLTIGTADLPSCVNMILEEYAIKGQDYCSSSMPNYFENREGTKGCTQGLLNSTLSGPALNNQPTCYVYSNYQDNINNLNSCLNQKMLDSTQTFGNNATKQLFQPIPGGPILVSISFTDNTGIQRNAYTRESFTNFLNATNPNWKSQGIDLDRNIAVADVAKAYFIDRTLSAQDIQL